MAINNWVYPEDNKITGSTKISDADNKIQAGLNDLVDWANGTGNYVGTGFKVDFDAQMSQQQSDFDSSLATWEGEIDTAVASFDAYSKTESDTLLSNKQDIVSGVSSTEIGYLDGVTSPIQTQLNSKQPSGTYNTIIGTDSDINTSGAYVVYQLNFTDGVCTSHSTRALTPSDIGAQPSGTYNTVIGTDTDISTSGATIIDNIYVTDGVITSMGTRSLSLSDLGISNVVRRRLHVYNRNPASTINDGGILINDFGLSVSYGSYTNTSVSVTIGNMTSSQIEQSTCSSSMSSSFSTGSYISETRVTVISDSSIQITAYGTGFTTYQHGIVLFAIDMRI